MSLIEMHKVLPNNSKMPIIGIGTFQASNPNEVRNAVDYALSIGYRHIDTAAAYGNEGDIGAVLKKWFDSGKLKREDVFITTKLLEATPDVERQLKMSLKNLQLDYVDLYLIHWPFPLKRHPATGDERLGRLIFDAKGNSIPDGTLTLEKTWARMEEQVDAGRTKEIGISNFSPRQVERIVKSARIMPATNQVELHAYFQQRELREVCDRHNIPITSYASLGSYGRKVEHTTVTAKHFQDNLLENPVVKDIAKKRNKSVAQVLLRHLIQEGLLVIPKSVSEKRIKENFEIFDFELSQVEIRMLRALDKGYAARSFQFLFAQGNHLHPEYPFDDVLPLIQN